MEWIKTLDQLSEHGNFSLPDFEKLKLLVNCAYKVGYELSVVLDDVAALPYNVLVPFCTQGSTEWSLGALKEPFKYDLERDHAYLLFLFGGKVNLTLKRSEWDIKAKDGLLIPANMCRQIAFAPDSAFYISKTRVNNASPQPDSPFLPRGFSIQKNHIP